MFELAVVFDFFFFFWWWCFQQHSKTTLVVDGSQIETSPTFLNRDQKLLLEISDEIERRYRWLYRPKRSLKYEIPNSWSRKLHIYFSAGIYEKESKGREIGHLAFVDMSKMVISLQWSESEKEIMRRSLSIFLIPDVVIKLFCESETY